MSSEEKNFVRQQAKRHRDQLEIDANWSDNAADIFFEFIPIKEGAVVASYYPLGKEIDPSSIVEKLWKRDVTVCLPVTPKDGEGRCLRFAKWSPQSGLVPSQFGILEPAEKEWVEPDIVIVPLLAFDQRGYRIGYGKGHYDETLAGLRAKKDILAVGLAYAEQAVLLALPIEPHDQKLDLVVTPQRIFDFRR